MVERWLLRDPALPITAIRRSGTVAFLDRAAAPLADPEPLVIDRV